MTQEIHMSRPSSAGADRARVLLNDIPDRFNDFCKMDQFTFGQLADWILENVESQTAEQDISVEESLFVFFDIVAQGNGFQDAAYGWNHDLKLTQAIFLNVLHALQVLRERMEFSSSCPPLNVSRSNWRLLKSWRRGKARMMDPVVKVGGTGEDALEIDRENLIEAMTALHNFIHERRET